MSPRRFDLSRFEAERAAQGLGLGQVASWREQTESTNDDAAAAAKGGTRASGFRRRARVCGFRSCCGPLSAPSARLG
jgi:hypothetical protein